MKLPKLSKAVVNQPFSTEFKTALQFTSAILPASGGSGPRPGCFFVGTNCYGGYQTCKYCCGDGRTYDEGCGGIGGGGVLGCIGAYGAPPCPGTTGGSPFPPPIPF